MECGEVDGERGCDGLGEVEGECTVEEEMRRLDSVPCKRFIDCPIQDRARMTTVVFGSLFSLDLALTRHRQSCRVDSHLECRSLLSRVTDSAVYSTGKKNPTKENSSSHRKDPSMLKPVSIVSKIGSQDVQRNFFL